MQFLFNKKTLWGFVGFMLIVGLLVHPAGANKVVAEGGNTNYLPLVVNSIPQAQSTEVVVFGPNATWKYFDRGSEPGSGWQLSNFDDSSWGSGSAPLGYGNGNERTLVSYGSDANNKFTTTYFRKTFSVDNPAVVTGLSIDLVHDDGAIVYLNGREVLRSNMPDSGSSYSTWAKSCDGSSSPIRFEIDHTALVQGANTLAVSIHQCNATSSDISFGLALTAKVGSVSKNPPSTPTPPPVQPTAKPTAVPTTNPTAVPTLPPTGGKSYFVTTSGSSSGDGSASRPWSLQHALSHPSALRPGDTIWLRGGTYKGQFTAHLKGTSSGWITIRAYPGERVILSDNAGPVLDIYDSAYVNFWGLEITSSYSKRTTSRSESTYGIRTYQGAPSHHIRFINMIVHDVQAQGIGWWQAMSDTEIYGSLFYFNGTNQLDHGIYLHNDTGTKAMIDNFIFDNASHGVHGYVSSSGKYLNNIYLEGNTAFNNGSVGYTTTKEQYGIYKRNFLIGGSTARANNITVTNNYSYYPGSSGIALNLGYSSGSANSRITNNYFAGGRVDLGGPQSNLTMSGNTGYVPGGLGGFSASTYPNNSWSSSKPTGVKIFVRPNKYENNRANITIFNWDKANTVTVSASSLGGIALKPGDQYELRNVQNYFGDIVTGTYDGKAIVVPMTGHSVAQPVGLSFKPGTTFPEFGAFVLIVKGK